MHRHVMALHVESLLPGAAYKSVSFFLGGRISSRAKYILLGTRRKEAGKEELPM